MTDEAASAALEAPKTIDLPHAVGRARWLSPVVLAVVSGGMVWFFIAVALVFSDPRAFVLPHVGYGFAFSLCILTVFIVRAYANRRDEPTTLYSSQPGLLTIRTMGGREATLSVAAVKEFATSWSGANVQVIDLVLRDGARLRLTPKPLPDAHVTLLAQRLRAVFLDEPKAEALASPRPSEQIEGVTITEEDRAPGGYRSHAGERVFQAEWSADPRQAYRSVALATMASGASALVLAHQASDLRFFSVAVGVWCVGCAGYALMRLLQSDTRVRVRIDQATFALTTRRDGALPPASSIPIAAIRSLKWTASGRLELSYDEPSEIRATQTMALPMMSLGFIDQLALERLLSAEIAKRKGVSASEL